MKILLVEDESKLSQAIEKVLVIEKYKVNCVFDGLDALNIIKTNKFDLIIMDIMLPGMNGIDLTKKIRSLKIDCPIIMLTAKSQLEDKIIGLDSGADDYLSKPFEMLELLARIRALTRRGKQEKNNIKTFHDITLNPDVYLIKKKNKQSYLTKKEFILLEYFIRNKNKFKATEDILEDLWPFDKEVDITVVWVFISNLRKKLKFISSNVIIVASRGRGYQIKYVQKNPN